MSQYQIITLKLDNEWKTVKAAKKLIAFVSASFREQQARLRRAVARHKDLQDGVVLDTMEKGGEAKKMLENSNFSDFNKDIF